MRRYFAPLILTLLALLLSACNSSSSSSAGNNIPLIRVVEPWARISGSLTGTGGEPAGTPPGDMEHGGKSLAHGMALSTGAAYMKIRNAGNVPDRLLLAQSDIARSTELHTVETKDGVMAMHPVESIEIPPQSEVELKPGSFHVMLIGLTKDLKPGDRFSLTLHFEKVGNIEVQVEVRQP
jgi:copper(I)-binding protein